MMAGSGDHVKKLGNIRLEETVFFLCDMQEKFRPAIKYFEEIVEVSKRLVSSRCSVFNDILTTRVLDVAWWVDYF